MASDQASYTTVPWVPDIKTGLSGDAYLLEELDPHITDISGAHRPGVYTLELSTPATTAVDVHATAWREVFDVMPDFLIPLATAERVFYVGAAADVYSRLEEHLTAPNRSTTLAQVFPIHSIVGVQWFENPDQAFQHEHQIAITHEQQYDNVYVHVR